MAIREIRSIIESFRKHPILSCVQALAVVVWMSGFFITNNFIVAVTPAEAVADGKPLPPGWSAGVMNHGEYFRWWTIRDNPLLFGAGVAIFPTVVLVMYLIWKKKRQSP